MSLINSEQKKNYSNKADKNTKVAKLDKKKLNIIRQSGQKAGDKFSIHKLLNKKAKVIPINIGLKKNK